MRPHLLPVFMIQMQPISKLYFEAGSCCRHSQLRKHSIYHHTRPSHTLHTLIPLVQYIYNVVTTGGDASAEDLSGTQLELHA